MISQLTGTLTENDLTEVVVDVNGVGYAVSVPLSTGETLGAIGGTVRLYTLMTVREDDIHLYGFASREERRLFSMLTTVNGVGPRLALNVLSAMSLADFSLAIGQRDIKTLSRISGIGKRTAERLIVDLKDKIGSLNPGTLPGGADSASAAADTGAQADAVQALETLGFKHDAAESAVRKLAAATPDASAENLIRQALSLLNS